MNTNLKLLATLALGNAGLAYGAGPGGTALGPAAIVFIAFLALYLVGQLLPGVMLFCTLLRELLAPAGAREAVAVKKPIVRN